MLKVSIPHSSPGESRGRDYTPEAFFSEDPHKEEPSVRSHHRPCRVVPRHIQIAAAGTGQVQVPWEPGSPASGLCQNSRTEPEATGPDAHRVVDPPPSFSIISTHPSSPPLPPVFRWPRPGPSSCDSCSSARLPLSLSRPTRPYFVSLAPARCFDEFSLLPFPFLSPPQPHWTQFPSRHQKENSPRPLSSILVCLRLVLFAPASLPPPTTSTHVPLSSRRVPCNSRVRQHLVLVSIRSSRPHFHLKDNVSPPSPSRLLNWFAPVRSDEAVASGRREARSAKRSNADCQDQRSRVVKHPSFPHGARNKT